MKSFKFNLDSKDTEIIVDLEVGNVDSDGNIVLNNREKNDSPNEEIILESNIQDPNRIFDINIVEQNINSLLNTYDGIQNNPNHPMYDRLMNFISRKHYLEVSQNTLERVDMSNYNPQQYFEQKSDQNPANNSKNIFQKAWASLKQKFK